MFIIYIQLISCRLNICPLDLVRCGRTMLLFAVSRFWTDCHVFQFQLVPTKYLQVRIRIRQTVDLPANAICESFSIRDAMIISLMDTATSFLGGVTIFAILGNLAHESGKNVTEVVTVSTGLAFVSYPDAIAKFEYVPQVLYLDPSTFIEAFSILYFTYFFGMVKKLFSVLFFTMLLTLGIGSTVSATGCVVTIICDDFPHWKRWIVVSVVGTIGFFSGLVYVTPVSCHAINLLFR